jgi:hypothetical protein
MKKTLLTSIFLFIIFQLNAQYIAVNDEPEVKLPAASINWENQKLRSDLTLNESQFAAVKEIMLERFKARQIVEEMFKNEPKKLEARLIEIDQQFDGEFAQILTEKQYKKYLKLQGRNGQDAQAIAGANKEPEGPNFNDQIQALIQKATTPALDTALLPQHKTSNQEFTITPDSLKETLPLSDQSGNELSVGKEKVELSPAPNKEALEIIESDRKVRKPEEEDNTYDGK